VGRPALGASAKTKTGSVRVTASEDDYFKRTYGSLGKFLQRKVNEELAKAAQMQTEMEKGMRCSGDTHVIPHRGCVLR
jgi:hypothetical protein